MQKTTMTIKAIAVTMVLLAGCFALAQEAPRMELQAGYAITNFSPNFGPAANLNGWTGSMQFNVNKYLGFVGEAGAGYGSDSRVQETQHTYLFGPRLSVYRGKRANLFGHVLAGPGYLRVSNLSGYDRTRGFASAMGGGVDLTVNRMFAVRLVQLDYFFTRYANLNQRNVRFSSGMVFRFGGESSKK